MAHLWAGALPEKWRRRVGSCCCHQALFSDEPTFLEVMATPAPPSSIFCCLSPQLANFSASLSIQFVYKRTVSRAILAG